MNWTAVKSIYFFEMARFFRTIAQSFISPVLSTSLYFVVFGAAIGSRIQEVEGVSYGAFIVPGLIMLSVITQSISNASFGIYFPKFIGTIFELLSAPVNFLEIVMGYVGAAATKALLYRGDHPHHGILVRRYRDPASVRDGGLSGADLHQFLAHGVHHRYLGGKFRAAAAGAAADRDAAGVSGRLVLLDLDAAAGVAGDLAFQSGGLSDLGLPLVLLRQWRMCLSG